MPLCTRVTLGEERLPRTWRGGCSEQMLKDEPRSLPGLKRKSDRLGFQSHQIPDNRSLRGEIGGNSSEQFKWIADLLWSRDDPHPAIGCVLIRVFTRRCGKRLHDKNDQTKPRLRGLLGLIDRFGADDVPMSDNDDAVCPNPNRANCTIEPNRTSMSCRPIGLDTTSSVRSKRQKCRSEPARMGTRPPTVSRT